MARRSADPYSRDVHQLTYLSGQFLLAMPGMADSRFDHAIIAMCAHDEGGALGIGLGATIDGIGFHTLLDQFDIAHGDAPNAPVHYGGPVEPRRGFVLHSHDWQGQDSVDVSGRWVLSSTVDVLRAIAVLGVVVFHLDEAWLPGGFAGVDIFFVISGFLITTIISRDRALPTSP